MPSTASVLVIMKASSAKTAVAERNPFDEIIVLGYSAGSVPFRDLS